MPPPAAPTTASEAIPSRPGSTLAGQFQRAPRSAAPTAEASATHAAPPTPQKDARWRRPSAGTTLDDTASTASVSATSAPTSAPTSVPTPAPTAPMPAAKASSARKTAPKSPPAPVSPGPAFLGAPSPRVASGSAEAPVAAPVAAPAPAAAPLPTRAPTVSHRVETPSKPTGASYPRSASVDVSPAPALIPSSPAAPAAPLAWTQRLPSVAPRTPSASRYASQSSGDDSLMHKFMHEIADELDSLDAIGGSFAVTSWPTPGQKSAAAAAASETAPTAAAELDTPSIRVGSGVWADPRAEERAAEAERAAEEARAAEAARAAKAARAAEEARAAEAARAEAARAAEDRAPSRTAHQFDDADEDALLLEKLPASRAETPVYAAFARSAHEHRLQPRASLRGTPPPRPLGARDMPRAPSADSEKQRKVRARMSVPAMRPDERPASIVAGRAPRRPYTSPMLTSSPYASPRVGAPASPRVDAPASPAIGGAPAAIGTTVVPTQMRPASVAGMAGPAVRPVSGPGTAGPTMRPASVAGMTSPAMRPASAAATVRPGVARAASLGAASPTVGVRPASVAATRMPGSPVPGSPVPGAARASPLADATNRDKPTGLSAAAAAAQLKHRRSLLGAFRKDDAKPDAARARVPSGSSEKENAAARPMSPAGDAVGARHSWFNGLLHRRQTQMLMSVQNLTTTVEGCQALLRQLGATLTPLSRAQSTLPTTQQGPLQYAVDQIYDHTEGAVTACRPMRFRVEYTILPVSSQTRRVSGPVPTSHAPGMPGFDPRAASRPMSPAFRTPSTETTYATSVTFSHEKGSSTTFRTFMAKLRRDWHLDARDAM
ncbi:GIN4 [Malassezia furfur]|nr:GIN4 [Malassezia furfur]